MDPIPARPPAAASDLPQPGAALPLDPIEALDLPLPDLPADVEAPAGPEPPPLPVDHAFIFHGRTDEYFRIWIVNTLLTLLTCGIFFAWAKVRKRRYLRGSTELLGHRFDYRADPRRLLIGNAIIVVFFIAYSLFGVVYPSIRYGVIAVGLLLLPWIVVRSLSFNASNTVYRGMRFRFNSSLSRCTFVYLLESLLIVVSLGFYYPAWVRSRTRFVVAGHRLGDAFFRFDAPLGPFYLAYLIGGAVAFATAVGGGAYVGIWTVANEGAQPGMLAMMPFFLLYGLGIFIGRQIIHAQLFNHRWNHTRLDGHHFTARMETPRWLILQLTNLAAIIGTCGLLYPWAVIRSCRYTASCLTFATVGSIKGIEHLGRRTGSAAGDSAAEFMGLDFGL